MDNYIFLTHEGITFQPDSISESPDVENLQVIGFATGISADEAYNNLLITSPYLKQTLFKRIFCYKLDKDYEQTRKDYKLRT